MEYYDLAALAVRWADELRMLDEAGLPLLALRLDQLIVATNEMIEAQGGRPVEVPEVGQAKPHVTLN